MLTLKEINFLTTESVAELCKQQTDRYKQAKSSDSRFCYELLRRAACDISEAWDFVYIQYQQGLASRIKRKLPLGSNEKETVEDLVQNALLSFQKYALNLRQWSKFSDLGSVLIYMNRCADSAVRDHLRTPREQFNAVTISMEAENIESWISEAPDLSDTDFMGDMREKVSHLVEKVLQDERDRIIFKCMFKYGQKPQEIASRYPEVFADAGKVSSCKRNLLKRLERDPRMQLIWKDFQGGAV